MRSFVIIGVFPLLSIAIMWGNVLCICIGLSSIYMQCIILVDFVHNCSLSNIKQRAIF